MAGAEKSTGHTTDGTNLTQEQIAKVLKVSQMQISRDTVNLDIGLNQKHAKTASNPKGSGRFNLSKLVVNH